MRWQRLPPMGSPPFPRPDDSGVTMRHTARQTRDHRTITIDCRREATSGQLPGDRKAFLACVFAVVMALGMPLQYQALCRGGRCLTRHSYDVRIRLEYYAASSMAWRPRYRSSDLLLENSAACLSSKPLSSP
jgi:hypothetical protein